MDASAVPAARLLSNGRYTVCLTGKGTGFSRLGRIALSDRRGGRWDLRGGLELLLRDLESGRIWPAGPGAQVLETDYMASWTAGSARLAGEREGIAAELELFVHPDLDLECRRLRVRNLGHAGRRLELTAYLEPVLSPAAAHEAHPVFSKLFLQTQWLEAARALVVRRRRRDPGEGPPPLILAMPGAAAVAWESDRGRLLPRGASLEQARWAPALAAFVGSVGSVLDPALALRRQLPLAGGQSAEILVFAGAMQDEQALLAQLVELAAPGRFDSVLEGARTSQLHMLAELGLDGDDAAYFELLAAALMLDHPGLHTGMPAALSPAARAAARARLDLAPERRFLLADDERLAPAELDRLRRGQLYWHALALPLDLVLVGAGEKPEGPGELNGCRRLLRRQWSPEALAALAATATLRLETILPALRTEGGEVPCGLAATLPAPAVAPVPPPAEAAAGKPSSLRFFNGHGGFSEAGREYVIRLPHREGRLRLPPQPWVNVIASEDFGFLVSETGAGTTWRGNSREHRLTPWANDPILDPHGEAFYLRDEESGRFWSPLPGPAPAPADYTLAHGLGYSRCTLVHEGLAVETLLFAAAADPLRLTRIQVRNLGRAARRLSFWAHYRLSLGVPAGEEGREICTEPGPGAGDLQARRLGTPASIAFAALRTADGGHGEAVGSGDRGAFLGPALDVAAPAALQDGALAPRTGAGRDPAFTQRLRLVLAPGEVAELCFLFGEADSEAHAAALCGHYGSAAAWTAAFAAQRTLWADRCDRLQVSTPDPALDLMVNAWLPYQTLSCRLHGRSAFYQSGGAFGFRDQLQDAGALLAYDPQLTRRQILLHAAHQFDEGDVMHWWHPLVEVGLRTRFADDLLWLPLLTAEYLAATGEAALLDESIDFVVGRPLAVGEEEALLPIQRAGQPADLYAHCCLAIDRSLTVGAHGLPLFGGGDWNDGMNRVGREGRGESVWMGFFLVSVLDAFLPLVAARADAERGRRYAAHRAALVAALETAGWDGDWYRRGYYDDGTPLGSQANTECRIDALVQAWSVLSGAVDPERARRAMAAAEAQLVDEPAGLIRLLAPPFDRTPQDPGYIKGYLPGVRENGGQYTHAALWLVRAYAALGRRDRVARLLALLNPIHHGATPEAIARYQVEPYVVAADVYSVAPHVGRGGWTWYTGSSGWMLRVALESLLGLRLEGGRWLRLAPCIPDEWPGYTIRYRPAGDAAGTRYRIEVGNPDRCAERVVACSLDGLPLAIEKGTCRIPLATDGREHVVTVTLGAGAEATSGAEATPGTEAAR